MNPKEKMHEGINNSVRKFCKDIGKPVSSITIGWHSTTESFLDSGILRLTVTTEVNDESERKAG